jgi:hypothetical protein
LLCKPLIDAEDAEDLDDLEIVAEQKLFERPVNIYQAMERAFTPA